MKAIIILFPFFFFLNLTTNDILSCKDFKKGKFELLNKKTKRKYIIERTGAFQIEQIFDLVTNEKITRDKFYKMVWINDCEYNLIPVISKNSDEFDLYVNTRGGYRCSIIAIKGDCAVIETKLENEKFTSEIRKVRK